MTHLIGLEQGRVWCHPRAYWDDPKQPRPAETHLGLIWALPQSRGPLPALQSCLSQDLQVTGPSLAHADRNH